MQKLKKKKFLDLTVSFMALWFRVQDRSVELSESGNKHFC